MKHHGAPLEAVFFDLGDTITDLREGQGDYMARVVARMGRVYDALGQAGVALPEREPFCLALAHFSEERYQSAVAQQQGTDIYRVLRQFYAERGMPKDDNLVAVGGDAYCQGTGGTSSLRLGALEVLTDLLARGLRLGVISNTLQPGRYMDAWLTRGGLMRFFTARLYSSEIGVAKPHPVIFTAALQAIEAGAERCVHVGDRLWADVAGAQGVGMKAVLIEVAHRPERDDGITPDARIRELPELLDVLPGLFT